MKKILLALSIVLFAVDLLGQTAAAPTFSPAPGTFSGPQWVTVSSITPNSKIYYTVDGSLPTSGSKTITHRLYVSSTLTVTAYAAATGMSNSSNVNASYVISTVKASHSLSTTTPSLDPTPTPLVVRSCCSNDIADIETGRGTYNWSSDDAWTAQASRLGALLMYTVSRYPSWSTSPCGRSGPGAVPCDLYTTSTCQSPLAGVVTTNCTMKEFIVKYMQRHCHVSSQPSSPLIGACGPLKWVETDNEANTDSFWQGNYTDLAKLSNDISYYVHLYCGDCIVTAGSFSAGGDGFHANGSSGRWDTGLEQTLEAWGAITDASLPDAVSYHDYSSRTSVTPNGPMPTTLVSHSSSTCTGANTPNASCRTAVKDMTNVVRSSTILQHSGIKPWGMYLPVIVSEGGWGKTNQMCDGGDCDPAHTNVQILRNAHVMQKMAVRYADDTPIVLVYQYGNDCAWAPFVNGTSGSPCVGTVTAAAPFTWKQAYTQMNNWLNSATSHGTLTSTSVTGGNVWILTLIVGSNSASIVWFDGWLGTSYTYPTTFTQKQDWQGTITPILGGTTTISMTPVLLSGTVAPPTGTPGPPIPLTGAIVNQ